MAKTRTGNRADERRDAPEKLYMENTLLRISGALFCHDRRRAATRAGEIEVNRDMSEKRIVIRPDPQLGQPGPLAHKIFVALIKKHSDYGRPIQREVSFSRREIGRLIGRKNWGGQDSERLSRALHEIHHTFIKAQFRNAEGRYFEQSFNLFPEILIERREFASDPIEACTVTLAEPIIVSLQDEHFTCLNHTLMTRLGTIGQALYLRLFFHLANRYDGRSPVSLSFQKRYDDICAEWLGGLTVRQHKCNIADQLGPHLDQLVAAGFLASHRIAEAKSRDGFTISFIPGEAFFVDYDRFYRRRQQGELQWQFRGERREIGEPLKVAYLFAEKRTRQPASSIGFVSSKEVDTAKQLLSAIGADEVPAFLDFALSEAAKTRFDVQTLGGVKHYVPSYLAMKKAKAAEAERKVREQRDEAERIAYDAFRRAEADALFDSLPREEQAIIEEQAHRAASRFNGSLREGQFAFNMRRFTMERHPDRVRSFEEWRAGTG